MIIIVGLLGLVLGSFVNALVWRFHEQEKLKEGGDKTTSKKGKQSLPYATRLNPQDLSITKGRSMCPTCHHTLAAKDLVPVLSWLWLRGKCRYCAARIPDSPLVELAMTALFMLAYSAWPHTLHGVGLFQFSCLLFFVVIFVALAVYDLRWFLLPDRLVFPLIAAAAIEVMVSAIWTHSFMAFWQPLAGAAIIFGLFYTLFQVSKGRWIGGGDVKIALALGLIVGSPLQAFLVIFFASLLGTVASVPLLLHGGKKELKVHIPFGPYLLVATLIAVLFGARIADWYMQLFIAR